ncbi:LADA_0H02630g1_1 [Lachancea dasiensis]|uniref:LADA_0H02630g1_1 n=1 Tax=Lachancea dasiensis TaxID=1072105 RepID=A0A1G4JZT9_9SACH|nr:LADA_0H02630g1_1 [Lachancea dasiensis]
MTTEFDEVLNLEESFYVEGFKDGRSENLKHNHLEGKQYGLQVGFQRFIFIGVIRGVCNELKKLNFSASIDKNIQLILALIDEIPMDNRDESVQIYEKNIVRLKNKFRLLLMALSKRWKDLNAGNPEKLTFEMLETVSKTVAGELNAYVEDSGSTNAVSQPEKDMW